MQIRRVVTGHSKEGKSTVVSDEIVDSIKLMKGLELFQLWGADEIPVIPDDGSMPDYYEIMPPPGGFRFGISSIQPATESVPKDVDIEEAFKEMDGKVPIHTTDSIDCAYVISGEIYLLLDDKEVLLKEGDTYIQNGTRHGWLNKSDKPCKMLFCCIGTKRK